MSVRTRLERSTAELEALLREYDSGTEVHKDWHGYVGEAIAALRAALGHPMPVRLPDGS